MCAKCDRERKVVALTKDVPRLADIETRMNTLVSDAETRLNWLQSQAETLAKETFKKKDALFEEMLKVGQEGGYLPKGATLEDISIGIQGGALSYRVLGDHQHDLKHDFKEFLKNLLPT
jgi:hypothetical protein